MVFFSYFVKVLEKKVSDKKKVALRLFDCEPSFTGKEPDEPDSGINIFKIIIIFIDIFSVKKTTTLTKVQQQKSPTASKKRISVCFCCYLVVLIISIAITCYSIYALKNDKNFII